MMLNLVRSGMQLNTVPEMDLDLINIPDHPSPAHDAVIGPHSPNALGGPLTYSKPAAIAGQRLQSHA